MLWALLLWISVAYVKQPKESFAPSLHPKYLLFIKTQGVRDKNHLLWVNGSLWVVTDGLVCVWPSLE